MKVQRSASFEMLALVWALILGQNPVDMAGKFSRAQSATKLQRVRDSSAAKHNYPYLICRSAQRLTDEVALSSVERPKQYANLQSKVYGEKYKATRSAFATLAAKYHISERMLGAHT